MDTSGVGEGGGREGGGRWEGRDSNKMTHPIVHKQRRNRKQIQNNQVSWSNILYKSTEILCIKHIDTTHAACANIIGSYVASAPTSIHRMPWD